MAINTDSNITADGTTTSYAYQGGPGAAIVTGTFDGATIELEFSLDGANYAPIGRESILFQPNGFAIGDIPACDVRWRVRNAGNDTNLTASVEDKG